MTTKSRGRPKRGQNNLCRDEIINKALQILDDKGDSSLTMRALARELNINPMSIYHHIGTRDELLSAMVSKVYAGISDCAEQLTPGQTIQALLSNYCQRSLRHAKLTLCLISTPGLDMPELAQLSQTVQDALISEGLAPEQAQAYLDILIDYSHGFILAAASQHISGKQQTQHCDADARLSMQNYWQSIVLILAPVCPLLVDPIKEQQT
jgi:AcrR family transcriptional regulator